MKSEHQWEFLKDVARLVVYSESVGIHLTGGELFRTKEQQEIHLENGSSWTKHSKHQDRLAIDFNYFVNSKLTYNFSQIKILGKYWESLNELNRWGGFFRNMDTPHFERNI